MPSFKETLAGFGKDVFFENENAESLAKLIEKQAFEQIDIIDLQKQIENRCNNNTWSIVAKRNLCVYKELF